MNNEKNYFDQGYNANRLFSIGNHDGMNPYKQGTFEFKEWEKGWSWYIETQDMRTRDMASDIADDERNERERMEDLDYSQD